jgi:hypothetical protein
MLSGAARPSAGKSDAARNAASAVPTSAFEGVVPTKAMKLPAFG